MKKYVIADIVTSLNCGEMTSERAKRYMIKNCDIEPKIIIETDMKNVREYVPENISDEIACYLWEGNTFYKNLIARFNGTMLHASVVVVDDDAFLFSAPSGTGKSTHTGKWLELFGDKAYILNDDKPAIRILEDGIYAYGTPWSGKHDISVNKGVKIRAICFLERSEHNWITNMDKQAAALRIYHAALRKLSPELLNKELETINTIVNNIKIYQMGCTPTLDAAKMAYNVMSTKEVNS